MVAPDDVREIACEAANKAFARSSRGRGFHPAADKVYFESVAESDNMKTIISAIHAAIDAAYGQGLRRGRSIP